jgi:hypothetical protein
VIGGAPIGIGITLAAVGEAPVGIGMKFGCDRRQASLFGKRLFLPGSGFAVRSGASGGGGGVSRAVCAVDGRPPRGQSVLALGSRSERVTVVETTLTGITATVAGCRVDVDRIHGRGASDHFLEESLPESEAGVRGELMVLRRRRVAGR